MPRQPDAVQPADQRERGATAVEYAILVSLIAAVIAGVVATLGLDVASLYQQAADAFP